MFPNVELCVYRAENSFSHISSRSNTVLFTKIKPLFTYQGLTYRITFNILLKRVTFELTKVLPKI